MFPGDGGWHWQSSQGACTRLYLRASHVTHLRGSQVTWQRSRTRWCTLSSRNITTAEYSWGSSEAVTFETLNVIGASAVKLDTTQRSHLYKHFNSHNIYKKQYNEVKPYRIKSIAFGLKRRVMCFAGFKNIRLK